MTLWLCGSALRAKRQTLFGNTRSHDNATTIAPTTWLQTRAGTRMSATWTRIAVPQHWTTPYCGVDYEHYSLLFQAKVYVSKEPAASLLVLVVQFRNDLFMCDKWA